MPPTWTGEIEIDRPLSDVYQIIVDYDRYRDWMPLVSRSKLLAREGDLSIAELRVEPPYSRWTVECVNTPNRSVLMRKIGGDVPVGRFEWSLDQTGSACRVSLSLEKQSDWRPWRRGPWTTNKILSALTAQAAELPETSAGEPIDILEIVETKTGLILRLLDKEYLLKPLEVSDD